VAHAAAVRALVTQPPAVLLKQVGDPLLLLRIGIWDALLALLRPGAEPEARALRAYTRRTGDFMACARREAMRQVLSVLAPNRAIGTLWPGEVPDLLGVGRYGLHKPDRLGQSGSIRAGYSAIGACPSSRSRPFPRMRCRTRLLPSGSKDRF
jgi:hypothetical protein